MCYFFFPLEVFDELFFYFILVYSVGNVPDFVVNSGIAERPIEDFL